MMKLLATIHKELLLLWRDRAGLLVLFVMPAVLVVVLSLVQNNILKIMGETHTRMLFVDKDMQHLSRLIEQKLATSESIEVVKEIEGKPVDSELALQLILAGEYQFGVIVPAGFTKAVSNRSRQVIAGTLDGNPVKKEQSVKVPDLVIYFDPAVRGTFRTAVVNALNRALLALEISEKMDAFTDLFPKHIREKIDTAVGSYGMGDLIPEISAADFKWDDSRMLHVQENSATRDLYQKTPTSVQQNVPAWALFGMFFIIVPMAGSLIQERRDMTLARLNTMPVSFLTLLGGKLMANLLVCMVQFGLILIIGVYILPLLGTPQLEMGTDPLAIVLVAVSAALAAAGLGLLLGSVAGSFEQAAMLGPILIVIAAAIGGIMVPVYAMPKMMQSLSVLSPLGWGMEAFLKIFVRGGDIRAVVPETGRLLAFFLANLLVAWIVLQRRVQRGH